MGRKVDYVGRRAMEGQGRRTRRKRKIRWWDRGRGDISKVVG